VVRGEIGADGFRRWQLLVLGDRLKVRLWRYDPDGSLHEMASGFVCGNGVDWSPDNKTC
jgi:sugar lactone lactonase YvrE